MKVLSKKSLGISSSVIAFALVMAAITPNFIMTDEIPGSPGFSLSIDDALGTVTTLENVMKSNSGLKSPTYLPSNAELIEIRTSDDSDYISMLYSSEEISDIGSFTTNDLNNLDLKIYIQKMENNPIPYHGVVENPIVIESEREGQKTETYILETPKKEFEKLSINLVEAVYIPSNDSDDIPNNLMWWDDGMLYSIHSVFDKTEMISIAESME